MSLLILTSIRHQLTHPSRVMLTVGGVSAAVALLFATAVLNGTLRASIDLSARGIAGDTALEVVAPIGGGVTPSARRAIARSGGVRLAVPLIRGTTRLRSADGSRRVSVLGVPPAFTDLFQEGLGPAFAEIRGLQGASARLGPALGEDLASGEVELETPRGFRRIDPVGRIAPVPFANFNGGSFVLLGLATANRLFERRGRVDAVYVVPARGTPATVLRKRLEVLLHGRGVLRSPGGQAQVHRQAFDSLAQLTELGAVGALWVALFAVFNAMSMSLAERRRDVALLAVLGASRAQLAGALFVEAAAFGAAGAVAGMALGYLVADLLLARTLESYPFLPLTSGADLGVTPETIAMTVCASLGVAVLGAAVPVRRTLGATPVAALSVDPSHEWARYRRDPRFSSARLGAGGICCLIVAFSVFLGVPFGSGAWAAALVVILLTGTMLVLPPVVAGLVGSAEWLLRLILGSKGLLAVGSLVRNRGRTTITVGVLALSLSLVIGLGSALFSFESAMTREFTERYGPPLYVTSSSYTGLTSDQPLSAGMARRIARVPGVRDVYPERYLPFDLRGRQLVVVSAPMVREARDGFSNSITGTRGPSRRSVIKGLISGGVVPSTYTAARHDLELGARFPLPGVPLRRSPRVVGFYDDVLSIETMYMERSTYLRLSGDASIDRIAVAPQGKVLGALSRRLQAFLDRNRVPAVVEDRATLVDSVLANVRGAFAISRALQLAALVIACLIVAGTMLTTVHERRWEFAICRALGMSRARIRGAVILEALVIGLAGVTIAFLVGLATGLLMLELMESRFLWEIDYGPSWHQLLITMSVAVAVVPAVAFLPANIAGRASVVEALGTT